MISPHDLLRVAIEIMLAADNQEGDDHRQLSDEWASSREMEEGCMATIANSLRCAFEQSLVMEATEGKEVEIEGETYIEQDMSWALEMCILSAFRWGFETAREFSTPTTLDD